MNGTKALEYLKGLCEDIDAGRRPRRLSLTRQVVGSLATAGFAVGLAAVGLGGCGAHSRFLDEVDERCSNGEDDDGDGLIDCDDEDCFDSVYCSYQPLYGDPFPDPLEDCADGADNDGDGLIDCDDPDCPACDVPLYGFPPFEEDCADDVDNDGDGLIDCDDPDCVDYCDAPVYGFPPFEENCADDVDNDGDGLVDCDDLEDCGDLDICSTIQPLYADVFPDPEVCNDGEDNDGDGLTDCEDPDCEDFSCCVPVDLMYGAPFEFEDCENELDDDCDGLIDCEDPFCAEHELCQLSAS